MPYTATVYQVMIASPSDVAEERSLVRQVVDEWNAINSAHTHVVLMPVGWETHATPGIGRPQELINQHVLEGADLLVALFWNRLGTHTGKASSGTVEEIEKHVQAGKPAMIYFSSAKVNPKEIDTRQIKALDKFKKEYQPKALVDSYVDLVDFRNKFSRQLAQTVIRDFKTNSVPALGPSSSPLQLSEQARKLLIEAAKSDNGMVVSVHVAEGFFIETNGQQFVTPNSPRDEAMWGEAIDELLGNKLLKDNGGKGEVLSVTNKGYKLAESLEKKASS